MMEDASVRKRPTGQSASEPAEARIGEATGGLEGTSERSYWLDRGVVEQYAKVEADHAANWYEREVNLPSLISLIPSGITRILDYGCGTGKITAGLAAEYPHVEGADISPAMIGMAREQNPELPFFVWDGKGVLSDRREYYDVVFSKLVLMFVDDLPELASVLRDSLKPGGCLVASITHPAKSAAKKGGSYFEAASYSHAAGARNTAAPKVLSIHRPLEGFLKPFFAAGFRLEKLDEPAIPDRFSDRREPRDTEMPKRLNVRLVK